MRHDAERDAAAYLGGVMRARTRRRFEGHLVDCEDCWREVNDARIGRSIAESARELAPQNLREMVRAAVAAVPQRRRRLRLPILGASLAVALLAAGVFAVSMDHQPAPIVRAVADFHEVRMPGAAAPSVAAPDLSGIDLTLTSATAGDLDGVVVDAYTYRDPNGRRLLLYLSDTEFPLAAGARRSVADGPWRASIDDLELLCSDEPHSLLALSDDPALLGDLATALRIADVPR